MVALVVIVSLVLALLLYVLFTTISLKIDTTTHNYSISFGSLMRCAFMYSDRPWLVVHLPFYTKKVDILRWRPKRSSEKKEKRKGRRNVSFGKVKAVLASFKVRRFDVNLDLGDVIANAMVVPWFAALSGLTRMRLRVNYQGEQQVSINVTNNIARILWAFFKY